MLDNNRNLTNLLSQIAKVLYYFRLFHLRMYDSRIYVLSSIIKILEFYISIFDYNVIETYNLHCCQM